MLGVELRIEVKIHENRRSGKSKGRLRPPHRPIVTHRVVGEVGLEGLIGIHSIYFSISVSGSFESDFGAIKQP